MWQRCSSVKRRRWRQRGVDVSLEAVCQPCQASESSRQHSVETAVGGRERWRWLGVGRRRCVVSSTKLIARLCAAGRTARAASSWQPHA